MNSIPEFYKTHPLKLKHIIPLDFKAALKLPDSHTWTIPVEYPVIDPVADESVPVIDLQDPDSGELVREACEKWGVFQAINHGVPASLLRQIERHARRLFELPARQKLLAVRSPDEFTGYGAARIAQFFPKLMWSEGFAVTGSPEKHARRLWPHGGHTTFCHVMEDYQKEMKLLSETMVGSMLKSLGVMPEDVNWFKPNKRSSHHSQALLQLNSYPVCPDPTRAMGLGPHTDSSLVTLLYQSNTSGLQLRGDGGWITVPPLAGAIIVNVGDLMHVLSNGRFKSALHRAVVDKVEHRISVAYFYGPPREVQISPSMKLTDLDHPPLYWPVTWKQYLDAKAVYFNRALDLIRVDKFSAQKMNTLVLDSSI